MGPRLEREKQKTLNRSASRGHVEPLDAVKCYWGQRGSLGYQPLAGEVQDFWPSPSVDSVKARRYAKGLFYLVSKCPRALG